MPPKKKPKKVRKELSIQIRVNAEQKRILSEAAATAGAGLSTWMLIASLAAAAELKARKAAE